MIFFRVNYLNKSRSKLKKSQFRNKKVIKVKNYPTWIKFKLKKQIIIPLWYLKVKKKNNKSKRSWKAKANLPKKNPKKKKIINKQFNNSYFLQMISMIIKKPKQNKNRTIKGFPGCLLERFLLKILKVRRNKNIKRNN